MNYESAITHLECTLTGERFEATHPHRTNPSNGKPLFARYDLEKAKATLTKASLADRRNDMWRYREVMPVIDDANIIALGEAAPLYSWLTDWQVSSASTASTSRMKGSTPPVHSKPADSERQSPRPRSWVRCA